MRACAGKLVIIGAGMAFLLSGQRAWGQQQCDDFDQCTVQDSCQLDGSCRGTPVANGTACDDHNPCTLGDTCLGGNCVGTFAPPGTACTSSFGDCVTDAECVFGFCFGDFVECPDDGNLCTFEFCNPASGQCETVVNDCQAECVGGECNPANGICINIQNKPNGTSCDDFNSCTSIDRCQGGECQGSVGLFATPTPTVTGVQQPTPTHTPTLIPTLPPTLTPTIVVIVATASPTRTRTPTLTPTVGPSFTATPTLPPVEEVDINCDDLISAADLPALVALLSSSDPQPCGAFDVNRDGVEDGEDIRALIRLIFALG